MNRLPGATTIRHSILAKGLTLIAVPLMFQLAFIGLVSWIKHEGSVAELWAIHSKDVISQAQRCRVRLLSTHGLIQGYIITRDPSFERKLVASAATMPIELAKLGNQVLDNSEQSRLVAKIGSGISKLLGFIDEGRRMVLEDRMTSRQAADRRSASQVLLEAVDRDIEQFLNAERLLDAMRDERLSRSWASLDRLLLAGGIASVLCTVMVAMLFSRNIGGRVAGLTENVRRLAEGRDLTPPIYGADEIARLDIAFREMAATLQQSSLREREQSEQMGRRAEELAYVNGQLREKAQENEMFVYSVSHDLRSPLVNLQGFSKELGLIGRDLVRLIDAESVPAEVRRQGRHLIESEMAESIAFIQSAVTRLAAIIEALLRLSRAGRIEYRHQEVDLGDVVRRVASALRGSIEERGAIVTIEELPRAWGDPTALEQVFANLIGNAVNYLDPTRPGRIEIMAVEGPVDVEIEGVSRQGLAVYAVRDNGQGIAASHQAKVFSAFQRLHADSAKGEGIGLTLVRRMVERHGGKVWFESELGRGTTFYVALPSAEGRIATEGGDDSPSESNTVREASSKEQ